ncbi:MAG: ABC transporter permease [Acetivibrionales bacterium]|jgi:spermidine/putrescine transport system permease protein|nr:ABC transporter permease [Clostridiaceae bacterium]HOA54919.1 ABC transporter permease [Clostridiales bacterium]HPZ05384.1 ABC transporter permease [Clostridiales bacterium]HQD31420.1 ABC transporter permease [Clostridiales bacterium]
MKKGWISYPYILWMIIFTIVPLLLVMYYGFTKTENGTMVLTPDNFIRVMEPTYLKVLWRSVLLALVSTVVCFIIGYPVAMILAGRDISRKSTLVLLFVIPMWMNFLLRTYAWMTLLDRKGLINTLLGALGLPQLNLLYTDFAVILGMVYNFLPFMVLPIYSVLRKIDRSLIEAAEDLGSDTVTVFRKVIFPLSLPGVVSGITMVFMPAVTTFIISKLLGGSQYMLIGNLIEDQFMRVYDWNFGSAVSIIMMLLILLSMGVMARYDKEGTGGGLF